MKVLLSGGNQILQRSVIRALVQRNHDVRLLARDAVERVAEWPARVEPWVVTNNDPRLLHAAAAGCDGAILLNGSLAGRTSTESGESYSSRELITAAGTTSVGRLVFVFARGDGSLETTLAAEALARSPREWIGIGTSTVFGTGDDPLTLLLVMMRTMPAVPIIGETHVVQPLWHEDLARAAAAALSLPASQVNCVVEVAGPETVTADDVYARIAALTDRHPVRLPVPAFVARYAGGLAGPLSAFLETGTQQGSRGGEVHPDADALSTIFAVEPTGVSEGLRRLSTELLEISPADGVGSLEVKRFSIDVEGSRYSARDLLREFRLRFSEVMPIEVGVEPASRQLALEPGRVLTMALPGRGHVQVRVEEVTDERIVVSTLQGHALAGIVQFSTRDVERGVRFDVMTCDTAARVLDWVSLSLGGARIQDANWTTVVERVGQLADGVPGAIQTDARKLSGDEAESVTGLIRTIVQRHRAIQNIEAGALRPR